MNKFEAWFHRTFEREAIANALRYACGGMVLCVSIAVLVFAAGYLLSGY